MKTLCVILLSAFTILTSKDIPISFEYKDNDYPITDEMIRNAYIINNQGDHKNDKIYWRPTAILKDNKSQQVIFIALGGYPRPEIHHFYAESIPDELIQSYNTFVKLNNLHVDVTKKIKDSINNATIIDKTYFKTKMDYQLGMNSKEAISVYGNPTNKIENKNATKLIWDYYNTIYGKLEPGPRGVKIGEDISEELFNKVAYGFILEINFINDKANYIYMRNMEP